MERAIWDVGAGGLLPLFETVMDFIPFMKYHLLPTKEQEWYKSLTPEEQLKLDLHETFGLALIAAGPAVARGGGKLVMKAAKKAFRKKPRPTLPIEDALAGIEAKSYRYIWEPFSYEAKLTRKLKGAGFAEDEVGGVVESIMSGSGGSLKNVRLEDPC